MADCRNVGGSTGRRKTRLWPALDPVLSGLVLVALGFCIFVVFSVSRSAQAAESFGGTGIVVDETDAPLAGAHVLIVIYSRGAINVPIPWRKGRIECGPEYYTKSDAQGKFVIPDKAMEFSRGISLFENRRPWMMKVAYVPGYTMLVGGPNTGIGQNDEGIFRIKGEAVTHKLILRRHQGTAKDRAEHLVGLAAVGCACRSMHKALWAEFQAVLPAADRENDKELGRKPGGWSVDEWRPTSGPFQCRPTATIRGNDGIDRPLHTFID